MGDAEMVKLGAWIMDTLRHRDDESHLAKRKAEVEDFCKGFPVPGI
jgi:glycine/serine hydroxymethyltransferase